MWLDRLVRWKRWVAASKLQLRDGAKVRAAEGATAAASDGAAAAAGSPGGVDPALARLASAAEAVAAGAGVAGSASVDGAGGAVDALDARFMARFSIAPVSDADLEAAGARVLISGPRGVRAAAAPPGAPTLAALLASGAVTELEARGCSVAVNGRRVPLLAARDVRLRSGDVVSFEREPALAAAPLLRAPASNSGSGAAADAAAAGDSGSGSAAALDVFLPGRAAPLEVPLRRGAPPASASAPARRQGGRPGFCDRSRITLAAGHPSCTTATNHHLPPLPTPTTYRAACGPVDTLRSNPCLSLHYPKQQTAPLCPCRENKLLIPKKTHSQL